MQATELESNFFSQNQVEWELLTQTVKRGIICYDNSIMLVKVEFQQGGIGELHQHPHTQITYVESGEFVVEISDIKRILKKGDVFYVPSNALHGVECIESGMLIDVFSPKREEFIK